MLTATNNHRFSAYCLGCRTVLTLSECQYISWGNSTNLLHICPISYSMSTWSKPTTRILVVSGAKNWSNYVFTASFAANKLLLERVHKTQYRYVYSWGCKLSEWQCKHKSAMVIRIQNKTNSGLVLLLIISYGSHHTRMTSPKVIKSLLPPVSGSIILCDIKHYLLIRETSS